jgi:hypothetical protein
MQGIPYKALTIIHHVTTVLCTYRALKCEMSKQTAHDNSSMSDDQQIQLFNDGYLTSEKYEQWIKYIIIIRTERNQYKKQERTISPCYKYKEENIRGTSWFINLL